MTDDTETPLQALIRELGLHLDATFVPRSQTDQATATKLSDMQINWRVRLYREKGSDLTTKYSEGIGHLPKAIRPRSIDRASVDEYNAITQALETGRYSRSPVGAAPMPAPSITDVLYCLVSDASAIDAGSFEDWASEYGYETDSRKAESVYRACLDIGLKLRAMVGDANLQRLREAFQDY